MTLFVLKTESIISYEESLLDKFELHLSLQIDDHSAIITIGKEPLDKFRSALKGYVETSDLRSYISEIAAISIPKFDRISPEFNKR